MQILFFETVDIVTQSIFITLIAGMSSKEGAPEGSCTPKLSDYWIFKEKIEKISLVYIFLKIFLFFTKTFIILILGFMNL